MLLTIDIGNTNVKAAIFKDHELIHHFTADNFDRIINSISSEEISEAAISSVVPQKTESVSNKVMNNFGFNPFIISEDVHFNINIKYNTPNTLGIDRVCSAEGAFILNEKKLERDSYLIAIDMGTATTINIVKHPNEFIGGLIAPGVNTMFKSLEQQTSQLPELTLINYKSFIGNDTNSSIASGVVNSSIGLIEKSIESISKLDDCERVITYLTGGMAEKLKKYLPPNVVYDKLLVLRGIKSVYDLNNN